MRRGGREGRGWLSGERKEGRKGLVGWKEGEREGRGWWVGKRWEGKKGLVCWKEMGGKNGVGGVGSFLPLSTQPSPSFRLSILHITNAFSPLPSLPHNRSPSFSPPLTLPSLPSLLSPPADPFLFSSPIAISDIYSIAYPI